MARSLRYFPVGVALGLALTPPALPFSEPLAGSGPLLRPAGNLRRFGCGRRAGAARCLFLQCRCECARASLSFSGSFSSSSCGSLPSSESLSVCVGYDWRKQNKKLAGEREEEKEGEDGGKGKFLIFTQVVSGGLPS